LASGPDNLAMFMIRAGRPIEALEVLAEARPILQRLADADPGAMSFQYNLAKNHRYASEALDRLGMWREAEKAFKVAVAVWQKLAVAHPSDDSLRGYQVDVLEEFGWWLWTTGRSADAVAIFGQERATREQAIAAGPAGDADRNALANCETRCAAPLLALGRISEARAACERAIAI